MSAHAVKNKILDIAPEINLLRDTSYPAYVELPLVNIQIKFLLTL